jgi:hypothetical protein
MDTNVLVAWVGIGGTLGGALIGSLTTWFIQWSQNKEKYQQMAFEKRLQAHQQAYALCGNLMSTTFTQLSTEETVAKVIDWYYNNCLYLDSNSREVLWKLTRSVQEYTAKHGPYQPDIITSDQYDAHVELRELQVETQNIIAMGVGVKYIPEIRESPATKKTSI